MNQTEKTKLIVECDRLRVFLGRNQLVQANAIAQKIENILLDVATKESTAETIEEHYLWPARRSAHNSQNEILGGFTEKAKVEADLLAELLRVKEPENAGNAIRSMQR